MTPLGEPSASTVFENTLMKAFSAPPLPTNASASKGTGVVPVRPSSLLRHDEAQLRQAVNDVTSEALGAAAKQILVASPTDLASVKRMLQMARTLPSTFMDKVAADLGIDSTLVRSRKPELIAHVESILAADPGLNA